MIDATQFSDDELTALTWALDELERSPAGEALYSDILVERSARQVRLAREEGWHVDSTPPRAPDWGGS